MVKGREAASGGLTRDALVFALALFCCAAFAHSTPAKKTLPEKPIDINAATLKELEELPGVGPTTAKAIVLFRTRSGRFRRVEDLLAIRGISEPKLKKMRPYVTLGPPPPAAAPKKMLVTGGAAKIPTHAPAPSPSPQNAPSTPPPNATH